MTCLLSRCGNLYIEGGNVYAFYSDWRLCSVLSRQAGRRLEALYSERGGVPVLFTSPYYVQLMDEVSHM